VASVSSEDTSLQNSRICDDTSSDAIEGLARICSDIAFCDDGKLIEKVNRLFRPANKVTRGHIGIEQHVV
jgi:hypothetical protein